MTLVFLDANVIAKPVTRTLLMVGSAPSGFRIVWSATAEQEATRHMRPRAVTPSLIRERFGVVLGPTGADAECFADTRGGDRQIISDAMAAGAQFLVTEDVDDFALDDLAKTGVSAVNPDLFLALRMNREAYALAISLFVERQVSPPTTAAQFHSAVARQHPRLFAAHADLYDVAPEHGLHCEPAVVFRGVRCLRCEQVLTRAGELFDGDGLCRSCRIRRI